MFSTGTSVKIVASSLLSKASSLPSAKRSFSFFPLILSILSKTFSTVLYSASNFIAVFSPIPAIPGILSLLSPIKPFISMICSGLKPYFSLINSGV